ncbi:hypothetical protein [Rubrivirga marina]|uniref:Uncharacterized protein n=1 Tax=Rubrivirga marina TaxID=1196024 RepID=A0A271ITY1_9BACT|nr:hypothetical protein [Rubrivirga marina]PAP74185.1 hypothetical protein BSZ37_21215 [Rubrivirga marina]
MLHPAFLIAAAVNDEGHVELPAAGGGTAFPIARAHFAPDDQGGFVQRVVPAVGQDGRWETLDMAFFARCLALALGALTPDLFAVRGVGVPGQARGRLARRDPASEEARLQTLRAAFLVHLAAYEGRLV